jgi:hypothetical protein
MRRAKRAKDDSAKTIGLMRGATAHAASAVDRLSNVLERADALVRRLRATVTLETTETAALKERVNGSSY